MKDGQIVEEGRHNDLIRISGGEYSNLIKSFHDSKEQTDDNEEQGQKRQNNFFLNFVISTVFKRS